MEEMNPKEMDQESEQVQIATTVLFLQQFDGVKPLDFCYHG